LATYYQNVLRGRAGLLTPAQAWDRLREGFADAAQSDNDDTLEQAAAKMYKTHTFRRIYWSGAAYWLTVDRDLRRSSDGKLSMELALSRFRDCCLPAYRDWRPEEFVAKLDALLGVQTFSVRYREFAAMKPFPDWRKLYADLGIHDDDGAHLQFDAAAPGAKVREAIMAPR
jgi:predicted metalloprotease with PDZ domain